MAIRLVFVRPGHILCLYSSALILNVAESCFKPNYYCNSYQILANKISRVKFSWMMRTLTVKSAKIHLSKICINEETMIHISSLIYAIRLQCIINMNHNYMICTDHYYYYYQHHFWHWRVYTEGKACTRCLPKAKEPKKQAAY